MALRPANLAPGRIKAPRSPFQGHGHGGIEPVQIVQKVGLRSAGGREQRVQNDRLAVQPQMPPLGLQLAAGQPPVHAAAGGTLPAAAGAAGSAGSAGSIDEFAQDG